MSEFPRPNTLDGGVTTAEQVANHWLGRLLFRAVATVIAALGMLWISQIKDSNAAIMERVNELRVEQSALVRRITEVETRQAVFDAVVEDWRKDMDSWRAEWREIQRRADADHSEPRGRRRYDYQRARTPAPTDQLP